MGTRSKRNQGGTPRKRRGWKVKYRYQWSNRSHSIRTRYYRTELAARSAIARHIGWFELGAQPETGVVALQKESNGP
jgi:hypothetical protein